MGPDDRHAKHIERLDEATNRLHSAETVEECYDTTIEAFVTVLGFDWCTLAAPAPDRDGFEIVAISAEAPLKVGYRHSASTRASPGRSEAGMFLPKVIM